MHRDKRREHNDDRAVLPGRMLRQRALGSSALYRVIEQVEHGVRVEVVEAPGLAPGASFVFSEDAIAAMEVLYAESENSNPTAATAQPRRRLA